MNLNDLDENDYSANGKDRDPIEQVLRYVKQIREGKVTLANGRDFGNVDNTPFYCYIIADLTSTLRDRAETSGYTKLLTVKVTMDITQIEMLLSRLYHIQNC